MSSNSNKGITLASICKLVLCRSTMMSQSAICKFFASISVMYNNLHSYKSKKKHDPCLRGADWELLWHQFAN